MTDEAEAAQTLYSSKERINQIVRKSRLSKRADESIDILLMSCRVHLFAFRKSRKALVLKPSCQSQHTISSWWRQPSASKYSNRACTVNPAIEWLLCMGCVHFHIASDR